MNDYIDRAGLQVATPLAAFVETRVLPGLGLDVAEFWLGTAAIFAVFAPRNRALLARRDELQAAIDARYLAGEPVDETFLRAIGYLVSEPAPFTVRS